MPELLAPAGDLERLKIAVRYGADAVYFGGQQFSLRARASNFTLADIQEAVSFAHAHGCKAYVTVNIIPHEGDLEGLEDYLATLESFGVDAIICASLAIAKLAKKVAPKMEVHISTQQTTMNSAALSFWQENGADRLVLGREVTLEELKAIAGRTSLPLEVFIHGGMCANYSGRCTISNLLTGRDANRGGCAHSCRWDYHLWQNGEKRDREDCLFSMGSRDMMTAGCLEDILATPVCSLKIEGRMKTGFYLAGIIKSYRMLLDSYARNGFIEPEVRNKALELIRCVENRESFAGFYPQIAGRTGQIYNIGKQGASQNFVARVVSWDQNSSEATVEVRNHFEKGDQLAILKPDGEADFLAEMFDLEGNEVTVANKPLQLLKMKLPLAADEYTFIHKKEK